MLISVKLAKVQPLIAFLANLHIIVSVLVNALMAISQLGMINNVPNVILLAKHAIAMDHMHVPLVTQVIFCSIINV